MEKKVRAKFSVHVSTVFLLLSLFCLLLEWVPQSSMPQLFSEFLGWIFKTTVAKVVLGELGPVWALIAVVFATARLIRHRKELFPVAQHFSEIVLCVLAVALFPVY